MRWADWSPYTALAGPASRQSCSSTSGDRAPVSMPREGYLREQLGSGEIPVLHLHTYCAVVSPAHPSPQQTPCGQYLQMRPRNIERIVADRTMAGPDGWRKT